MNPHLELAMWWFPHSQFSFSPPFSSTWLLLSLSISFSSFSLSSPTTPLSLSIRSSLVTAQPHTLGQRTPCQVELLHPELQPCMHRRLATIASWNPDATTTLSRHSTIVRSLLRLFLVSVNSIQRKLRNGT